MKVFWSWQSDTPGKVGRHFVRRALESAVEELKSDLTLDEPDEREALAQMHIDQDRQGVPGSPDLVRTILEKIDDSKVFVADVTPVGVSLVTQDGEVPKKIMNPNVAIELGYALKHLGERSFLMIMNEHYGSHGDVPFDLRGKSGPIMYRLAPDADGEAIKAASRELKGRLKEALALCLDVVIESTRQSRPFAEKAAVEGDPARFRGPKEYLGLRWDLVSNPFEDSSQRVKLAAGPAIFIRVLPTCAQPATWPVPKLADSIQYGYGAPRTFSGRTAGHRIRAEDGLGYYDCRRGEEDIARDLVFIFTTGELWSIDTWSLLGSSKRILIGWEQLFAGRLNEYASLLQKLGVAPPLKWTCGLTRVEGFELQLSNDPEPWGLPACVATDIVSSGTFDSSNENAATVLRPFFELIFEQCGVQKPPAL